MARELIHSAPSMDLHGRSLPGPQVPFETGDANTLVRLWPNEDGCSKNVQLPWFSLRCLSWYLAQDGEKACSHLALHHSLVAISLNLRFLSHYAVMFGSVRSRQAKCEWHNTSRVFFCCCCCCWGKPELNFSLYWSPGSDVSHLSLFIYSRGKQGGI